MFTRPIHIPRYTLRRRKREKHIITLSLKMKWPKNISNGWKRGGESAIATIINSNWREERNGRKVWTRWMYIFTISRRWSWHTYFFHSKECCLFCKAHFCTTMLRFYQSLRYFSCHFLFTWKLGEGGLRGGGWKGLKEGFKRLITEFGPNLPK